jgi:hypothetical protein
MAAVALVCVVFVVADDLVVHGEKHLFGIIVHTCDFPVLHA